MTEQKRPSLCIVAGPNGSGKTTTTEQLLWYEWTDNSVYINPDNIAKEVFGDWNSPEAVMKAARRATELRYDCLNRGEDFVFETVLSSEEKVEFVKKARQLGYFIRIFFVCTESPEINVSRITKRYLSGGHEVPISKVVSRYYKSLFNMRRIIPLADRAYFYDNSVDNRMPRLLFRTVDGTLYKKYSEDIPEWAKRLLK